MKLNLSTNKEEENYIELLLERQGKNLKNFIITLLSEAKKFERMENKYIYTVPIDVKRGFNNRSNLWSLFNFVSEFDLDKLCLREPADKFDCIVKFKEVENNMRGTLAQLDSSGNESDATVLIETYIAQARFVYYLYFVWLYMPKSVGSFTSFIKGLF